MGTEGAKDSGVVETKAGPATIAGLGLLFRLMWREPAASLGWLLSLLASSGAALVLPASLRYLMDRGFVVAEGINDAFVPLVVAALFLAIATSARIYLLNEVGDRIVTRLRKELFAQIIDEPMEFHHRTTSADLLSRLTADIEHLRTMLGSGISIGLRALITALGSAIMLVATSPKLALGAVVAIHIAVVPVIVRSRRLQRLSREAQDLTAKSTAIASEAISSIRLVKEFVREEHELNRYALAIENGARNARRRALAQSVLSACAIGMVFGALILVLWLGAADVADGRMSPGQLGQFMLYAVIGGSSVTELLEIWSTVQRSSGGVSRVAEMYKSLRPDSIRIMTQPVARPGVSVTFDRVSFSYPAILDKPVLRNVSINVRSGQRVALVGPSGGGKSTAMALLLRLYEPTEGRILVSGRDVRDYDPKELRQMISVVPQSTTLFCISAMENIRYGRLDATDEEVRAAAIAAEADAFIRALPRGYDEPLGDRGVILSGGQRQRIAIARAMLKDAPILLLDEATSALDAQSEVAVHTALRRLMADRTTLIIAHRLATVKDAHEIVVMTDGRVTESGTHHSLLARDGLYASLAGLQSLSR